jgi:hypothetical protein
MRIKFWSEGLKASDDMGAYMFVCLCVGGNNIKVGLQQSWTEVCELDPSVSGQAVETFREWKTVIVVRTLFIMVPTQICLVWSLYVSLICINVRSHLII